MALDTEYIQSSGPHNLLVLGSFLLAWIAIYMLFRFIWNRPALNKDGIGYVVLRRIRGFSATALAVLFTKLSVPLLDISPTFQQFLHRALTVSLIVLCGWAIILSINTAADFIARRHNINTADNLRARKSITQLQVLRRAIIFVVLTVTAASVLMSFEAVREYGVSLFASAGVAGLILGLAAKPVFTNLIAGVQIALTQPIRIEDAVLVEGEWGWIEEIGATFVVIRIWDWRRLILPLSYFIEHPFQNWTRESGSIIGSVFWHVDPNVPIAAFREQMQKVIEQSPLWDLNVINLQVTETSSTSVTLRGLMSARTSPEAWDLRCDVREKMLVWLQEEYPESLPRIRIRIDET